MKNVVVTGSFDDLRSGQVRFLEEASKLGNVDVLFLSDELIKTMEGKSPKFPQSERSYLLSSLRYVNSVTMVNGLNGEGSVTHLIHKKGADLWAVQESADSAARRTFCAQNGIGYQIIPDAQLNGFPVQDEKPGSGKPKKKVIVTGCYDWLHSGHVRFFEEVSQLGDLYVVVGHDENVRLLKGAGHPLLGQEERRYMAGAFRTVTAALISSGQGWMDAEPEIDRIHPDLYAVNEDGDKPEKREFCRERGIEYVVLKRTPKEGLPRRESTHLRGF